MKTRNIFYLALGFLALSCAKELAPETSAPEQEINYIPKTFTAGMSEMTEDATKTALQNGFQINWKANDAVTIIDNVAKTPVKYLASEAGATTTLAPATDGTGVAENATEIYAAYPWRDGNNALQLQNGDELKNCYITPDQRPSRGTFYVTAHYAMAKADDLDNLVFKNLNAFIKFTIEPELNNLVKAIYIFSNNDEELSGQFYMKWNNGDPKVVYKNDSANRPYVRAYNNDGLREGSYYLSIIPTTFEKGFTVVLQMMDGTQMYKRTEKKLTVAEGQILPMKTLKKADYLTDDVNYFVLYNEGFDVNVGGVVINDYFKDANGKAMFKFVSKHRNETINEAKNLYFVTPCADDAVISGTNHTDFAVIGMNKNQRSKAKVNGNMNYVEGGQLYLFSNLELEQVSDCGFVRGTPQNFGHVVISNCAFKNWTRTLLDMHNGSNVANSTLKSIVIEDSDFCFKGCTNEYSILIRQAHKLNLDSFKFVNNVVTSESTAKNFKFIGGYASSSGTGLTIKDCVISDNTFADVIVASFVTACGITGDLQLSRNLFDFPLSKFTDILSLYKDTGVSEIPVPQSGECGSNYYYYVDDDNKYTLALKTSYTGAATNQAPIKLSERAVSGVWDPVKGKFGAYSFKVVSGTAPAYNEVGAQRADMAPVTAALNSPALNYSEVNLGTF